MGGGLILEGGVLASTYGIYGFVKCSPKSSLDKGAQFRKNQPSAPTIIFEDNQSAIYMAKNPSFHGRSKHINIKFHLIREQVSTKKICLKYCPSEDMLADLLTKGIRSDRF